MGYSRVVVVDGWVMVSWTICLNFETMSISEDVAQQAEQAFLNIAKRWQRPGATLADVVRVRYIFPRTEDFEPCLPAKAATSRK